MRCGKRKIVWWRCTPHFCKCTHDANHAVGGKWHCDDDHGSWIWRVTDKDRSRAERTQRTGRV